MKEVEKIDKSEEGPDRVKDYLENIEKKIEMKRSMGKKIRWENRTVGPCCFATL